MNCLKCGKEIPEESKFCQNCGQAVESRQLELQSKQPKKTHKFLKYGCGCLCVAVTAFIILGFIIDCNMTPEEKAARKKQWEQEAIQKQQEKLASKRRKEAANFEPQKSDYWEANNKGSIPYLKAERFSSSKGDIVRITAGRDDDHGIMFQFPGKYLKEGFSYAYKSDEPDTAVYDFRLYDGKNIWRHFGNSDTKAILQVKKIDRSAKKIYFNIVGQVRNGIPDPNSKSSFAEFIPGEKCMTFSLDVSVWGTDFDNIIHRIIDHRDLQVGTTYILEKVTVLAPSPDPKDHIAAMKQMKKLSPGVSIEITGSQMVGPTKWYSVDVYSSQATKYSTPIARGWINSVALVAQKLIEK